MSYTALFRILVVGLLLALTGTLYLNSLNGRYVLHGRRLVDTRTGMVYEPEDGHWKRRQAEAPATF